MRKHNVLLLTLLAVILTAIVLGGWWWTARGDATAYDADVAAAEAVAALFLSKPENLTPYPINQQGDLPQFGKFLSLEGDGYHEAVWNIQGYEYVTAQRTARFAQGTLPVTMHVEMPVAGQALGKPRYVRLQEWGTGIREGDFGQALVLHVSR